MKYQISIIETLEKIIEVNATSEEEVIEKVMKMYNDEEIVLDSFDYVDTEFNKVREE